MITPIWTTFFVAYIGVQTIVVCRALDQILDKIDQLQKQIDQATDKRNQKEKP